MSNGGSVDAISYAVAMVEGVHACKVRAAYNGFEVIVDDDGASDDAISLAIAYARPAGSQTYGEFGSPSGRFYRRDRGSSNYMEPLKAKAVAKPSEVACKHCHTLSKHATSETSMGLCFPCFEARK